jgi:propionyl-CoA carboxylase alpha chain
VEVEVNDILKLKENYDLVRREAMSSFGDNRIFVEKYINNPRHIEIQVLADQFGNIVCLGERECSIQRNNQKIIEEAPSVLISQEVRESMYSSVKDFIKHQGYFSAGTIEFIVDSDQKFFFMEMNTRLQVEHTVTELITGVNIIREMVNISMGHKLSISQDNVELKGWSIEARICAEDPENNFMPSIGQIVDYIEPIVFIDDITNNALEEKLFMDSCIYEGFNVSAFYDSMLAKLYVYADTRQRAINLMCNALDTLYIDGIRTNVNFLRKIFIDKDFNDGLLSVEFIKQKDFLRLENVILSNNINLFLGVSLFIFLCEKYKQYNSIECDDTIDKEFISKLDPYWTINIDDEDHEVELINFNYDCITIEYKKNKSFLLFNYSIGDKLIKVLIDGLVKFVKIQSDYYKININHSGITREVIVYNHRDSQVKQFILKKCSMQSVFNEYIYSPLSGLITKINIDVNHKVQPNDGICVISAMKMENTINATSCAVIDEIYIKEGMVVNKDDVLVKLRA